MPKILSKKDLEIVTQKLLNEYPDAKCELVHKNAFELLIATILSAQCTDARVNVITSNLFKEHDSPDKILNLGLDGLIDFIRSAGFFMNKSKNIMETCRILVEDYNGIVPNNRELLEKLPGVGRKTANVVLSNAFGVPEIAVDTHVFRVSNRIGIVNEDNVYDTEMKLRKRFDKSLWTIMHHTLIFHGRRVCKAKKPDCENCVINNLCLYINRR